MIIFIWVIDSIIEKEIIDWIYDNMIWFENWFWKSIWEIEKFLKDLYIFKKILKEDLNDIKNNE